MTNHQSPNCKNIVGKSANEIFPDLVINKPQKNRKLYLEPPPPPDIGWIYAGLGEEGGSKQEDVPTALVLFSKKTEREIVKKLLRDLGYRADIVLSVANALKHLQSFEYQLIVSNVDFAARDIHDCICKMPSFKRRGIYYVLVGPNLHTMYDLEALSLSVNMVINNRELKYLKSILKKGFRDHEDLFGPLLETINDNKFRV